MHSRCYRRWRMNPSISSRPIRRTTSSCPSPWPAALWRRPTPTGGPITRWSATLLPTWRMQLTTPPTSTRWSGRSGSSYASSSRAAMPSSSCATPIRTGSTSSSARTSPPEGRSHMAPGGNAPAAIRLPAGLRAEHRAPAHPGAAKGAHLESGPAPTLQVGRQDVPVDVVAHRPGVGGDRHRRGRRALGRRFAELLAERHLVDPALPAIRA